MDRIVMAHGGGGELTDLLIEEMIRPRFTLSDLDDSAVLPEVNGRLALTTDSYVVSPLEFPGGNIGRLAVCGTVNDLAVCGACGGGQGTEQGLLCFASERGQGTDSRLAGQAGGV